MTNETPEEIAESIRGLQKIVRESADLKWIFKIGRSNRLQLKDLIYPNITILEYQIPVGNDAIYMEDRKVSQVSFSAIGEFSRLFLAKIDSVEERILEKNKLESASGALDTVLRREEFMIGPLDPSDFFRRRYEKVKEVYERHKEELDGFPVGIIYKNDFFAPKEILERAKKILEEAAKKRKGRTLFIKDMRKFTAGFRRSNENTLLFDPIDWYYTEDEKSHGFRKQLKLYS